MTDKQPSAQEALEVLERIRKGAQKGGSVKSEKKRESAFQNLERARAEKARKRLRKQLEESLKLEEE